MKKFIPVTALVLAVIHTNADACSVCFGDPNSSLTQSIGWGVWTLMGFIFMVLVLFAALFVNFYRRMKKVRPAV